MQQQDKDGNNLVHLAASGTNFSHLRAVLSDGYDVNARNNKGETALHIAFKHGRHENIAELLRHGANPNERDNAGNTPMDLDSDGRLTMYTYTTLTLEGVLPSNRYGTAEAIKARFPSLDVRIVEAPAVVVEPKDFCPYWPGFAKQGFKP
jgi:hypothetical protein